MQIAKKEVPDRRLEKSDLEYMERFGYGWRLYTSK
jgi:hypothetical protein